MNDEVTQARHALWHAGILSWKLWPQQLPIYSQIRDLDDSIDESVVLCSRQFGKCIEKNTLVSTPAGPIEISKLRPGDVIYGYNLDGSVSETTVLASESTGLRDVIPMYSGGRFVVAASKEHRWLVSVRSEYEKIVETKDLKHGYKFKRAFIESPLGKVHEKNAYVLGAMVGNGCVGRNLTMLISSPDCRVPQKIAALLGCHANKLSGNNYTWGLTTSKEKYKHSQKLLPNQRHWFNSKSHEKRLYRTEIETWDRESCLSLLAGLIDTDGSVRLQEDGCLRIAYYTGSKQLADDVQWLVDRLFQRTPTITKFTRRGSDEYTVFMTSNLHAVRILKQLEPYMVMDHKKYAPEYEHLSFRNHKKDKIGLSFGDQYKAECWDIQVSNESSLFVLHNEGLISHNSHLGVILAVEDCLRYDDVCILIVGPTLKQTREIVSPRLRRIAADAPPGLIRPSKSEGKWYIGTSELVMAGMDINSSAQRGKTVQTIYIEEIVESRPEDYLESLRSDLGPALTHSNHGKMIFLTTLPKVPDHPFITETMSKAELNNAIHIHTINDNKALTREQYEACVRRSGGVDTDDFKREYLCQIVRDRSLVVIPDYFEDVHVNPALVMPPEVNLEMYIDWGGVRDMTVALLMGYDFLRAKDLVFAEGYWKANTPTDYIIKDIKETFGHLKIKNTYADVPGQLQVDLNTGNKFPIVTPTKDDWEAQVNNMANRFTQKKIEIHPSCKLLRQSCRSGVFNKHRTDFDRQVSLGHMDALAALMYGIRHLDRSSPYPAVKGSGDWQWKPINTGVTMPIVHKSFVKDSQIRRFQ